MSSSSEASGTICGVELTNLDRGPPIFDAQIDNQKVRVSEPSPRLASTTKCSTCVYSSTKGTKAVEKAMLNSIPPKNQIANQLGC